MERDHGQLLTGHHNQGVDHKALVQDPLVPVILLTVCLCQCQEGVTVTKHAIDTNKQNLSPGVLIYHEPIALPVVNVPVLKSANLNLASLRGSCSMPVTVKSLTYTVTSGTLLPDRREW